MKKSINSMLFIALLTAGCGQFGQSKDNTELVKTSPSTNHIQLALSPFAPNPVKETVASFTKEFVKSSGRQSLLELFDAQTGFLKGRLTIPDLRYDSPRARAKVLGQPLLEASRFLRTNDMASLTAEPGGNLPGLLRSLPVSDPPSVAVFVLSPWYQPKEADAGFSMLPSHCLPTDDHLVVSPAQTPYGLGGYTNRLKGCKVIFVPLGDMPSDRADEALRLFWAKAIGLAGGSLVLYTRDLNRALEAALHPDTLAQVPMAPLALTGELAMQSAADYVTFAKRFGVLDIDTYAPVNPGQGKLPNLGRGRQDLETDRDRQPPFAPAKKLITTNWSVVTQQILQTNRVVVTNFVRQPQVSAELVTNWVTNWVLTSTLRTNLVLTTNTVFRTNAVISTRFAQPLTSFAEEKQ